MFIYFQRLGKGEGKRGRETSMCERNNNLLPLTIPPNRDLASNPGCALTGSGTRDLSVHRRALNPLSHTSKGFSLFSTVLSRTSNTILNENSQLTTHVLFCFLLLLIKFLFSCSFQANQSHFKVIVV